MMYRFTVLSLFCLTWFLSPAQEINHPHSIQHAFLENKGQWDNAILFKSKFDGGNLWIQQKKMVFHLQDFSATHAAHANFDKVKDLKPNRQTVVHLNFLGSNEVNSVTKSEATDNYYNYFIGNDESKWASEVRGYGEAILHDLYNGIDLKLIEELEQLKYEFHVQPYIDPSIIELEYAGQDNIKVDKKGNLVVATELGKIIEQKPYAYQIVNGNIREVECEFVLEGSNVKFKLGAYDEYAILVIDPVLIFATYSGSPSDNFGMTATFGSDGTAYSGGMIFGNAYPTPFAGAYDVSSTFVLTENPRYGITDVFISKYTADGTDMIWTTFLGGGDTLGGTETAQSMICDKFDNVYLYGSTSSTDFPIVGGYQNINNGGEDSLDFYQNGVHFTDQGTDIYVAKISSDGANLMASTYIGGSGNDGVNYKLNMPYAYGIDMFGDTVVAGIYSNFSHYDSLTINYGDNFRGEIMLDSQGNCVVASCTRSTDFPTALPFQAANGGKQDGVVFKLSSDLSTLQWSSYYGGSDNDACYSVKIDSAYDIVFAGGTCSNDLPNMGAGWGPVYNGGQSDGFVVKLNNFGTAVNYASYVGDNGGDQVFFVEIDRNNSVFLLGQSRGGNFPVINSTFVNPGSSQFVIELDPTLSSALHSTVFGNGSSEINISPAAFLVDICGNIYISGWGAHILQPVTMAGMPISADAEQPLPANGFVFYLLVIERDFEGMLYGTYLGSLSAREHVDGGTSRFDKNGVVYQSVCGGCGGSSNFPTTSGAWSQVNLADNCNNVVFKFDFELIPKANFIADDTIGCLPFTVTFDEFSVSADSYLWDFGNGQFSTQDSAHTIVYDSIGVYDVYLYVTDSICLITDTAHIVITVVPALDLTVTPGPVLMCTSVPLDLTAYTNGTATSTVWSTNINFTDTLNSPITDSTVTVTPPGSMYYYVLAENSLCSRIDSVEIEFIGADISIEGNSLTCLGEITIFDATSSNPLIPYTYVWSPDSIIIGSSTESSVSVQPGSTQYLYLTASSTTGCIAYDSILVQVSDIPAGLAQATSSDYLVPNGGNVTLSGLPNGYSYLWTPPTGVSNITAQQTDAVVDQTTLYTLFVTDGICTRSDTVLVKSFAFICDEPFVYVPNAFTPDGSSDNDILYVRGALIKDMVFRVYDRWGELVFESFDRNDGWDGNFRGKPMDPDTYDYYLKVTCLDDIESIIKGNVTLIR